MLDILIQNITISWLIAGGLFIFLEAMAFPGVGFLFAGCAAITTGGLIQFGIVEESNYILQASIFLSSSFLWAIILWVPLQHFHKKAKFGNFSNMIGNTATVYNAPLIKGKQGEVKWSGTIMHAMLSDNSVIETLDEGTDVKIMEVSGNILKVEKK